MTVSESRSAPGRRLGARAASRLRTLGWAALAAVCGLGWIALSRVPAPPAPASPAASAPHLLVEKVDVVTTDRTGRVHRRLRADELRRAHPGAKSELVRPDLAVFPAAGPGWRFTAERGEVSPDRENVYLPGAVRGRRGAARPLEIESRGVRVMLSQGYGESSEPSAVRSAGLEVRGTGMRIWLEEDRVELLAETRTLFRAH